ncbi:MAG: M13 family peptidase [Neisseriaceae bacterium]|nr:MAG: M13 family peptidase [Neisseriaceae bacterium]
MKKSLLTTAILLAATNSGWGVGTMESATNIQTQKSTPANSLVSGLDLANRNLKVRPQDDFYQYTNGTWLDKTTIPADKASWGAFNELRDNTLTQLRGILDGLSKQPNLAANSNAYKIVAMYDSFMNESELEQLGSKPIQGLLAEVNNLKSVEQIPQLIAQFNQIGVGTPYDFAIHQDAMDSTVMVADIYQSGLGLPDRDYYLKTDDKNMLATKEKYQQHVATMLILIGDKNAAEEAKEIVALETELAHAQWTKVENRDPVKTYNKYLVKDLDKLAPGYPWQSYLESSALASKVDSLIISQPSYISQFNHILTATPLSTWQAYFRLRIADAFAADLSKAFVDENFKFYGTVLSGVPQNKPRWKRGVDLVEGTLGEALGELYVKQYFPAENKAKMEQLVANLVAAYRQSIESLDWMSPATKVKAQEKLAAIMLKIGYPDHWRDYSALTIKPNDLIGNIIAAHKFGYQYELNKLGKPVDRSEWGMTPQTVNAYYNPELNEIVFPAAILQPPFFNAKADMAANYGGIGAVIGHEISHGFDDQGSQYDAKGNLHDWFTPEDHERFKQKTSALVAQYNAYMPIKGYHVNGELTLGENIADNSGLDIAYKAYLISLHGESAPVIDGLSGEQRFYLSWASVWRAKIREAQQIVYLKSDPHSPAAVRGNAPLRNQAGFYKAFDVKPSDKMYLAPDKRVTIW